MHTELKLHHVSPEQLLKSYIDRRLRFAVSRFGGRLTAVTTRISAPAPSPTSDLRCHISADFSPFGTITADANDVDAYSAIDRCIGKFARRCESRSARLRSGRPSRISIRTAEDMPAA